jgi:Xaa-Pro dipeptidase
MDMPMFYQGNPEPIAPDMTLFAHMIIVDSESETAMTLGRTYLTTESGPKRLSKFDLELIAR